MTPRCHSSHAWERPDTGGRKGSTALLAIGLSRADHPIFSRLVEMRAWYMRRDGAG